MKITITNKSSLLSPVFVIKEAGKIEKHSFFKDLKDEDKNYLKMFFGKDEKEFLDALILPSGANAIVCKIPKETNHRKMIILVRKIVSLARKEKMKNFSLNIDDLKTKNITDSMLAEVLATQLEIANFEFIEYKKVPEKGWNFVEEVSIFSPKGKSLEKSVSDGKIIGEEINRARNISNTPGADMTPSALAESARKSAEGTKIKIEILDEKQMEDLKMGAVLGVAKGAVEKPKFIIMEYWGAKKSEKPTVLVGKGVTFDTGGLDIKTAGNQYEMHMDMTGGASVIHTLVALAKMKVKKNIIALVPAVENAVSGSSLRPGDILKSMSGKTIEVTNTDAEGRIILADALTYANKYKPALVIDVATLTGAAGAALGDKASAIFSKNKKLTDKLEISGEITGDFVWPLPLWEEYDDCLKSNFADLANYTKKNGGAINAAAFLLQFAKDFPWVHIDIAPRMTTSDGDFLAKGNAGPAIALLANFLRK